MKKKSYFSISIIFGAILTILRVLQLKYAIDNDSGLFIQSHPLTLTLSATCVIFVAFILYLYLKDRKKEKTFRNTPDGNSIVMAKAACALLIISFVEEIFSEVNKILLNGVTFSSFIEVVLALISIMFPLLLWSYIDESKVTTALVGFSFVPIIKGVLYLIMNFVSLTETGQIQHYLFVVLAFISSISLYYMISKQIFTATVASRLTIFGIASVVFGFADVLPDIISHLNNTALVSDTPSKMIFTYIAKITFILFVLLIVPFFSIPKESHEEIIAK